MITADADQLVNQISKANKELKILQGYATSVNITADTKQLDAAFIKAEAELKTLGSTVSLISIKGDSSAIDSTISKVQTELSKLNSVQVNINADNTQLLSLISKSEAELKVLQTYAASVNITADAKQLDAFFLKAEAELKALGSTVSLISIKGDSTAIDSTISKVQNELLKLNSVQVNITGDNSQLLSLISKSEAELKVLQTYAASVKISGDTSQLDAAFLKADAELKALGSQISLISIKGDSSQIDSTISKVESELMNLKSIPVPITADASQLVASVAAAENQVQNIPPVKVPITADPTQLAAGVAQATQQAQNIPPVVVPVAIDLKQISAELTVAENDLRAFTAELKNATNTQDVIRLQNSIGILKNKIGDLKGSLGAADSGLKKVAGQTNSAAYAVTNLSRIVSDSAFGFIGIANNITPFIDSLAAAKKEAAATGQSLLANLGKSLTGPAGLSLAFAAVTTAITFAQIGFSAWTRSAKKTKDTIDEVKKSQEEFAKSLDSARSSALATGLALQAYVDVARNTKLSDEQRNEALKRGNEILGEHGKKLTLANIATKEITDQTNLYTQALIQQAIANKYTDRIAELTIQQTNLNNQLKQSIIDVSNARKELNKREQAVANNISNTNREESKAISLSGASVKINEQKAIAADKLNKILEDQANINLRLSSTTSEINNLNTNLKSSTEAATAAFGRLGTKTKDSSKDVETLGEALAKFRKSLKSTQDIGISLGTPQFEINQDKIKEFESILKKIIEKFNVDPNNKIYLGLEAELQNIQYENLLLKLKANLEKVAKAVLLPWDWKPKSEEQAIPNIAKNLKPIIIPASVKLDLEALNGSVIPANFTSNIKEQLKGSLAELKKSWQDYSKQLNDAATGFLTDAATNIAVTFGEALGAALSGGNFGQVFSGIFELLAGGVESLGKQLIAIGTLAIIAQQAIAELLANPFAAIGVGIALVALGAALKNLTKRSAFATGTRYAPGGMALVGERGPEMINLPRGSQVIPAAQTSNMMGGIGGQVEVFGVLRGQDIFFSNKKYGQTYGRTT